MRRKSGANFGELCQISGLEGILVALVIGLCKFFRQFCPCLADLAEAITDTPITAWAAALAYSV